VAHRSNRLAPAQLQRQTVALSVAANTSNNGAHRQTATIAGQTYIP
jgi:hypothetical protein